MAETNAVVAPCPSKGVTVAPLCALGRAQKATHQLPPRRTNCPKGQALTMGGHGPKPWPMPPRSKGWWTTPPRGPWGGRRPKPRGGQGGGDDKSKEAKR